MMIKFLLAIALMSFLTACIDENFAVPEARETELDYSNTGGADPDKTDIVLKKSLPSESEYVDVYQKTLFNPERKYTEEVEQTTGEPEATPARQTVNLPNLELVGTLKTSAPASYAFIRNTGEKEKNQKNKVLKYELGQWIGEYLISKIEASQVTLMKGEEVAVIKLKPSSNPGKKASPPSGDRRSPERTPRTPPNMSGQKEKSEKSEFEARAKSSGSKRQGFSGQGDVFETGDAVEKEMSAVEASSAPATSAFQSRCGA